MFTTNLPWIDISIIIVYIVGITWWGLKNAKNKNSNDYFLAGRSINWIVVGLSLFSASISTSALIGHSGSTYQYGLVIFNYNLISIFVMIFFAWIFLPVYIKSGVFTMPEFLERRFDHRSKFYFSAIAIIGGIFMDVSSILYGSAMIFKIIFPELDIQVIVIIAALIVASYTIPGGLNSVIKTEVIQALILIIGSVMLAAIARQNVGGWDVLKQRFHDSVYLHLVRSSGDIAIPWPALFLALPILGFYFWGNNQQLVQRVLSAKSVDHGRKGVLLTGLLTLLTLYFIFIPAMQAAVAFPNTNPVDGIYPKMVTSWMPNIFLGIMLAVMISALTASLSATLNSVSTLFTMDFYRKMDKRANSKKLVRVGQLCSTIVLIIGVLWAPQIQKFGTLINYYNELLSYIGPPIVAAFMLGLFWKRANATGIFYGLLSTFVMAAFMFFYGKEHLILSVQNPEAPLHWLYLAPINFVFVSLVMVVVSLLTTPPPAEKIEGYVITKQFFIEEAKSHKSIKFYADFRVWAVALFILCFLVMLLYW
ncbi:MAG: sodium/solute symporter [Bacteroidota bacterium]|nr:sodium/solute symporter [Bacteroidota bacterium]